MSGVDFEGRRVRKGAADEIRKWVEAQGGRFPAEVSGMVDMVSRRGSTPLVVAEGTRVLGVIELKDIVKGGIKERFARTAAHGHQDGDDHRRQPPDRGGDRGRSGRG